MSIKYISDNDTIIAQATPSGRSGIAILRISGIKSSQVALQVLGKLPKSRYADYLSFHNIDGSILDKGIAIWFPSPNSFTGEDVLELQCHGGPIILDLLLNIIISIPGIRVAQPGEFSARAFLNGKMDLIQAEAIADLIDANSKQAVHYALNSLQGVFSSQINKLVEEIINLRTHIEAIIDFPENEIDSFYKFKIETQLNVVIKNLNDTQNSAYQGSILREGLKIVIAGYPNAGKSSLLNVLSGRESSIVTSIPGTTRDVVREYINIDQVSLHIIDTAGINKYCDNEVERIGIKRALDEIQQADHILWVIDGTTSSSTNIKNIFPDLFSSFLDKLQITIIRNKIDLTGETPELIKINGYSLISISLKTNDGINKLRNYLKNMIGSSCSTESKFLARSRHIQALNLASTYLFHAKDQLINNGAYEFLAEDLRLAQQELNSITGKFTSDDLLGNIFSNFCIGK